jgi:hypothetical protein
MGAVVDTPVSVHRNKGQTNARPLRKHLPGNDGGVMGSCIYEHKAARLDLLRTH